VTSIYKVAAKLLLSLVHKKQKCWTTSWQKQQQRKWKQHRGRFSKRFYHHQYGEIQTEVSPRLLNDRDLVSATALLSLFNTILLCF